MLMRQCAQITLYFLNLLVTSITHYGTPINAYKCYATKILPAVDVVPVDLDGLLCVLMSVPAGINFAATRTTKHFWAVIIIF
jgi:hypothetical protein